AYNNKISNSAVTNVSGFGGGQGYQAGVADVGNLDQIGNNKISGPGYAQSTTPAWVSPIDTTSTIKAKTYRNPYKAKAIGAWGQAESVPMATTSAVRAGQPFSRAYLRLGDRTN